MGIVVKKPGVLTTVQDSGRFGYQGSGFATNGVMDHRAFAIANLLVDNDPNAPVLEFALAGPALRFTTSSIFAITGADCAPTLDGKPIPSYTAIQAHRGSVLQFASVKAGRFGCIAFAGGGIDVPEVMGSRSTNLKCQLGGWHGRALKTSDYLPFVTRDVDYLPSMGSRSLREEARFYGFSKHASSGNAGTGSASGGNGDGNASGSFVGSGGFDAGGFVDDGGFGGNAFNDGSAFSSGGFVDNGSNFGNESFSGDGNFSNGNYGSSSFSGGNSYNGSGNYFDNSSFGNSDFVGQGSSSGYDSGYSYDNGNYGNNFSSGYNSSGSFSDASYGGYDNYGNPNSYDAPSGFSPSGFNSYSSSNSYDGSVSGSISYGSYDSTSNYDGSSSYNSYGNYDSSSSSSSYDSYDSSNDQGSLDGSASYGYSNAYNSSNGYGSTSYQNGSDDSYGYDYSGSFNSYNSSASLDNASGFNAYGTYDNSGSYGGSGYDNANYQGGSDGSFSYDAYGSANSYDNSGFYGSASTYENSSSYGGANAYDNSGNLNSYNSYDGASAGYVGNADYSSNASSANDFGGTSYGNVDATSANLAASTNYASASFAPETPQASAPCHEVTLRVVPGPQEYLFTDEGVRTFYSQPFTVTAECDRMGYRLDGPEIQSKHGSDIITDGIAFGAVQVPTHGRPIIMLADRQTTGGYAKIGTVASVDIPKLVQCPPGSIVRFQPISVQEAQRLLREQAKHYEELAARVRRPSPSGMSPRRTARRLTPFLAAQARFIAPDPQWIARGIDAKRKAATVAAMTAADEARNVPATEALYADAEANDGASEVNAMTSTDGLTAGSPTLGSAAADGPTPDGAMSDEASSSSAEPQTGSWDAQPAEWAAGGCERPAADESPLAEPESCRPNA